MAVDVGVISVAGVFWTVISGVFEGAGVMGVGAGLPG